MNLYKIWLLFLGMSINAIATPKIEFIKKSLTVSVIIPCSYKHAKHLDELLHRLEQQSVLPNEVIISLSEYNKVEPILIENIKRGPWAFPCILLTAEAVQYAGENRNIGCAHASSDILILQDADDIPHPQRIEVIKYFFENYHVNHLMHQYVMVDSSAIELTFPILHVKRIPYEWGCFFNSINPAHQFHNGNIAISKDLFKKMRWSKTLKRAQDTDFNRRAYANSSGLLQLKVPLLYYRMFFSSQE